MGQTAQPIVVFGLGYGDCAKGATVDLVAAATHADRVVRFNGGQQAAHNVYVGGRHHVFQSYGSGTFSGARTWISHFCTVNPTWASRERTALRGIGIDPGPIMVDEDALVTTELHITANRLREMGRGADRHGSTGAGFGETVYVSIKCPDIAIRARDLAAPDIYLSKWLALSSFYRDVDGIELDDTGTRNGIMNGSMQQLLDWRFAFELCPSDRLLEELHIGTTVFEGAQGFCLDEDFGTSPHTTWSRTSPANALALCRQAGIDDPYIIGCLRTYATRHGEGPLPGEGLLPLTPPEPDNVGGFAGPFRTGALDPDIVRWAIDMTHPNTLAVSHIDVFNRFQTIGAGGGLSSLPLDSFGPVGIKAYGPRREDRLFTE